MDVLEAIQKRRSIRAYLDKMVSEDKIEKILEAARLAPSAGNIEPWHFIVVTDAEKRKALSKGIFARFISEAPVVIVACGDKKASADWYAVDTSLAVENMILTATSEGLGTCCVGSFNERDVASLLRIPETLEVLLLITVGYVREKFDMTGKISNFVRKRKSLKNIVSIEEYGKSYSKRVANSESNLN